jgi:hypothetical protein
VVQDAESALEEAKISKKAGYFLTKEQKDLEICPFEVSSLADNANKEHLHYPHRLAESRAEKSIVSHARKRKGVSRGLISKPAFRWTEPTERVRKAVARIAITHY